MFLVALNSCRSENGRWFLFGSWMKNRKSSGDETFFFLCGLPSAPPGSPLSVFRAIPGDIAGHLGDLILNPRAGSFAAAVQAPRLPPMEE